jgi:hypothetical protein
MTKNTIITTSDAIAIDITIINSIAITADRTDKIFLFSLILILKISNFSHLVFSSLANQLSHYFPPSIFFSLSSPPILNSKFSTSVTSPLKILLHVKRSTFSH